MMQVKIGLLPLSILLFIGILEIVIKITVTPLISMDLRSSLHILPWETVRVV